MIRLVQLFHPNTGRRVALVEEPNLVLIRDYRSVYEMAMIALESQVKLEDLVKNQRSAEQLEYDPIYKGTSPWQFLPAFDHPENPFQCLVSGTGLTHKASATNRQNMHKAQQADELTDSMRMYQWGEEGGKPGAGKIGVQPEWFYKGNGTVLEGHNQPLEVPAFANDGGEEPEIAGVYVIDEQGQPWRVGFCTGNEFSDHVMEKKNYLYLAPSKLRSCSIGPELVVDGNFQALKGHVSVQRNGKEVWGAEVQTGEQHMVHSLENLEYHHFKYAQHRIPSQAHVHYFGTGDFSFGHQIKLEDGDRMEIQWEGFGRALRNPIKIVDEKEALVKVKTLQ